MQIRCASCGKSVPVADTGVLPTACPHCRDRPVPDRLGSFCIVRLIAAGGMGEVYLGEHKELRTQVAIKLLPVAATSTGPADHNDALRQRFRREAQLTAKIQHPGVVHVLDLVEDRGRLFLVLELVSGKSLRSRLRAGLLEPGEAVRILVAAAEVLGSAHEHGVVHRDVKPENVMLSPDGRVRVLDFGIARALQDQETLTRTGEILGTPEYMAPEQLLESADAVDARTDVHALGVLGYELLTGKSPFGGQNLFQTLKLVESLHPRPPSLLRPKAQLPAAVDELLLAALAKDPATRPADGAAFAAAMRRAWPHELQPGASNARPKPVALPSLTAALLVGFLLAWLLGPTIEVAADKPPAPTDPGRQLAELAARPVLDAAGRAQAATLLGSPGNTDDGAELLQRGLLHLRIGSPQVALAELDRAARLGTEGARGAAAASWHAVYTALPMVLGAPSWLSATDRRRRDRLHGASASNGDNPGQEPLELASEPLLRACAQLTGAEPTAALTTLDAIAAPQRRAEHALIAVLAIRLAGADPASTARATAAWRDRFPGPLVRLLTSEPAAVETRLDELALDLEETSPDRWLFLLGATWLRSQRQPDLLGRLRAVGELMWLCGADSLAPFWLGALRAQLLPAQPASPGELAGLRALAASLPADDNPGAILLQSLLALHARDDRALDGLLATAPRPTDPALALLEFWSATTGEARVALQEALRGGRLPRRQDLAAGDRTAATVQAMHLWCNADASTEARRQQGWRAALASGADFALLPQARTRPANPTAMPSLVAVLQAHPRQDPAAMSPAFCAALRLCAGQGAELGSLARTYSQEISRGF